jgi:hypothetical protein
MYEALLAGCIPFTPTSDPIDTQLFHQSIQATDASTGCWKWLQTRTAVRVAARPPIQLATLPTIPSHYHAYNHLPFHAHWNYVWEQTANRHSAPIHRHPGFV